MRDGGLGGPGFVGAQQGGNERVAVREVIMSVVGRRGQLGGKEARMGGEQKGRWDDTSDMAGR